MNTLESPVAHKPSIAVGLIDQNLAKLAAMLEDVSEGIAAIGSNGYIPTNLTDVAIKQIASLNRYVQSIDGESIVESSRNTIVRHPGAVTLNAAVTGAVIAQMAVLALRNGRQAMPLDQRG